MQTLTFQLKADKCNSGLGNWTPQGPALFMSFKVETMKIKGLCA